MHRLSTMIRLLSLLALSWAAGCEKLDIPASELSGSEQQAVAVGIQTGAGDQAETHSVADSQATPDDVSTTVTISKQDAEQQIRQSLANALRAMERQQFDYLLDHFLAADVVRAARDPRGRIQMFQEFYGDPREVGRLIKAIEAAQTAEIQFNPTRTVATFVMPLKPDSPAASEPASGVQPLQIPTEELESYGDDLQQAIRSAVADLEQDDADFNRFVNRMLPLSELARWQSEPAERRQLQQLWPMWRTALLADLQTLQSLTPTLSGDGTLAIYRLPADSPPQPPTGNRTVVMPEREVRLEKTNAGWRFADNTTAVHSEQLAIQQRRPLGNFMQVELKLERVGADWRMLNR